MGLAALRILDAVAARGLETSLRLPDEPVDDSDWEDFANHVTRSNLWGEVSDAALSGDLPVTDGQLSRTLVEHERTMGSVLELEACALDIVDLLSDAGLDVIVLKGMATAHLDHDDPNRRAFSDVDLLAPPGSFTRALDVLEREGWRRDLPERRPGYDERFAKDSTLTRGSWVEVDLHRTLAIGPFGLWIDLEELWSGTHPFSLGGSTLLALDGPRRLLNACYAAILGDAEPKVTTLRDVALMVEADPAWMTEALILADRWRGGLVVRAALEAASERLGLSMSAPPTAHRLQEQLVLRSYRSRGGTNAASRLAGVLAVPGLIDRARYLRGLALPSSDHRRARTSSGRPNEWRTGLRELLRRRS